MLKKIYSSSYLLSLGASKVKTGKCSQAVIKSVMPGGFKDNFKDPLQSKKTIEIDMHENQTELLIDVDLPDIDKRHLELTVDSTGKLNILAKKNNFENTLQINKKKKTSESVLERIESEMKYYIIERCSDNLERTIQLPGNANR